MRLAALILGDVVLTAAFILAFRWLLAFSRRQLGQQAPAADWTTRFQVAPEALGGRLYWQLALVSVLGLFLEMLMIRWISSEVRIFAYFKNFVLIACFLGFGLGASLCRRRINLLLLAAPLTLLAVIVDLPWPHLRWAVTRLPKMLGAASEVQTWGVPYIAPDAYSIALLVAGILLTVPLFALVVFTFIPVGQWVGWYLEQARGIRGYTVNVLASLVGIALYTLLCFFDLPPAAWFAVAGVLAAVFVWRRPPLRNAAVATFGVCGVLAFIGPTPGARVYWSPYQKLTLAPLTTAGELTAWSLNTNDSWYQKILDLSPRFVAAHPDLFRDVPVEWNAYNLPYRFRPAPGSVLVLGSGMGNDVAAALRNGAGRVVAVEIDPLILRLGRELHFERPYSSPRVAAVVDDARSYIQNSGERFDLVVFSLLDSHTTSSHFTNIRIDNYVYTREALEAAQRLLAPGGMFIVKFQVNTPWVGGRLRALLEQVFGRAPLELDVSLQTLGYSTGGHFFIVADERLQAALAEPALARFVAQHRFTSDPDVTLTTDDWPYFYQKAPGLPLGVIGLSLVLVWVTRWFLRTAGLGAANMSWHFFFLGAGFLLLEAQIVSKMALLFGTTWVVNSIVIAGLLLLIIAANTLVELWPVPPAVAYTGIFLAMIVAYLVPVEKFLFPSLALKILASTAVLCLPVFFAGMVFVRSYQAAAFSGAALGANLLGALCGGVLESLSLWTGLKSLLIAAAVLYAASAVALRSPAVVAASAATPDSTLCT